MMVVLLCGRCLMEQSDHDYLLELEEELDSELHKEG